MARLSLSEDQRLWIRGEVVAQLHCADKSGQAL
jgi:hypothetical protein